MSNTGKIVAGIIVIAIICVAGFIVLNKAGNNANDTAIPMINETGTLIIEINSNHFLLPVDYTLYVDGEATDSFTLKPLEGTQYTKTMTLPIGADSKDIKVEVRSTGGAIIDSYDSKTVTIFANKTSTVDLTA